MFLEHLGEEAVLGQGGQRPGLLRARLELVELGEVVLGVVPVDLLLVDHALRDGLLRHLPLVDLLLHCALRPHVYCTTSFVFVSGSVCLYIGYYSKSKYYYYFRVYNVVLISMVSFNFERIIRLMVQMTPLD